MALSGMRLTLAVLEALASAGLAVFLAFPHAGVARQQAGGLQGRTQRRVYVQQRPRYSVPDRPSLAGWPASLNAHADVILADAFSHRQRRRRHRAQCVGRKIILKSSAIDDDYAGAGGHADSRNSGLAATGAKKFFAVCHKY